MKKIIGIFLIVLNFTFATDKHTDVTIKSVRVYGNGDVYVITDKIFNADCTAEGDIKFGIPKSNLNIQLLLADLLTAKSTGSLMTIKTDGCMLLGGKMRARISTDTDSYIEIQ